MDLDRPQVMEISIVAQSRGRTWEIERTKWQGVPNQEEEGSIVQECPTLISSVKIIATWDP